MKPDLTARLLTGKRGLSRPEKEAIFARVLTRTTSRRGRFRWPALILTLSTATAAMFLLFRSPRPAEFQARGGARASFRIACLAGPCRTGGKLLFEVSALPGGYFAAFARRTDGTIIWYFPDRETGESVSVLGAGGELGRAVVLGPEHVPGEYQVFGMVSPRPLSRADVRYAVDHAAAPILKQQLVVAP